MSATNLRANLRTVIPVAISAKSPAIRPHEWVETPTATRIIETLSYAQATADVVLVHGPGGAGKSATVVHYATTREGARYIPMSPATSGVVPALEEIGEAIGAANANGAAALHHAIVDCLASLSVGSPRTRLLILDEAQCLSDATLDQLRAIHDEARVGLALVGSPSLYSRFFGGEGAMVLEGLRHRIGRRLALSAVTNEDVGALLDAWGARGPKLRRELTTAASKPGGMRNVSKALRLAVLMAEREGRAPCEADVLTALHDLVA